MNSFSGYGPSGVTMSMAIPTLASDTRFEEIGIKKVLYNVDTRFRRFIGDTPTNFRYWFDMKFMNVASIKIATIELPNSYYNISSYLKTNSFQLTYLGTEYSIQISDGNYTATELANSIQTVMNDLLEGDWQLTFNEITGKITITELNSTPFRLDFDPSNNFPKRARDFGLGAILGFRNKEYTLESFYTGEAPINVYGDQYLLLKINDYDTMFTKTREKGQISSLAKIQLTQGKNNVVFYGGEPFLTKRFVFEQPVNIESLDITLMTPNGDIVDFTGQDWSFSVELEIIENSRLYEQYRRHKLMGGLL
jgi:hypothetical protein